MAHDPKKIAAECFKRGNEAIPKGNWDYAIEMYSTAVKMVPDNLMFRQTLRMTEQKKYGNNGKGAAMASMRLMGIRGKIKKARYNKAWDTVAEAAEEGLAINPWDPQLNADLGDACRELEYQEVAVFAYEESLKSDPTSKDVNTSLATLLEERGEYVRASSCWERILKADPLNGEARSKITALQAKSVMDRGGYETAENTRGVMADHEVARRLGLSKDVDGPGQSTEADLQRAIRKDPSNKDNYLKLGDHYRREGQLEQALELLQQALQVSGGDISIREMVEDVQIDLMRQALQVAKSQAVPAGKEAEHKQRVSELARELLNREIEVFAGRVDRYASDMRLKYELGTRYMKIKKWQLAIPLLQASRGDPRIKGESLVSLGKCFANDGKLQLARRQLEAAVPELKFDEKPDLFRDAHYSLARICEELKSLPEAEEYYQKVLEVDYGYKDTLDRLNRLQGGGEKG